MSQFRCLLRDGLMTNLSSSNNCVYMCIVSRNIFLARYSNISHLYVVRIQIILGGGGGGGAPIDKWHANYLKNGTD